MKRKDWEKEIEKVSSEMCNSGKAFEVDLFEKMNPGLIERLSKAGIEGSKSGEEYKKLKQSEQL